MNDNRIGDRIKKHRKCMGLTQEQLAKRSYVSRSAIGNFEIGKRNPGDVTVQWLSKVFGVSSEYLRTGKMSPYDECVERLIAMDYKIDVSELSQEHRILMLKFYDGLVEREREKGTKLYTKGVPD